MLRRRFNSRANTSTSSHRPASAASNNARSSALAVTSFSSSDRIVLNRPASGSIGHDPAQSGTVDTPSITPESRPIVSVRASTC